jgi:hypothetical protein
LERNDSVETLWSVEQYPNVGIMSETCDRRGSMRPLWRDGVVLLNVHGELFSRLITLLQRGGLAVEFDRLTGHTMECYKALDSRDMCTGNGRGVNG